MDILVGCECSLKLLSLDESFVPDVNVVADTVLPVSSIHQFESKVIYTPQQLLSFSLDDALNQLMEFKKKELINDFTTTEHHHSFHIENLYQLSTNSPFFYSFDNHSKNISKWNLRSSERFSLVYDDSESTVLPSNIHPKTVKVSCLQPLNENRLAIGYEDGSLVCFNLEKKQKEYLLKLAINPKSSVRTLSKNTHLSRVQSLTYDDTRKILISCTNEENVVVLWSSNKQQHKPVHRIEFDFLHGVSSLFQIPDSPNFLIGDEEGGMCMLDLRKLCRRITSENILSSIVWKSFVHTKKRTKLPINYFSCNPSKNILATSTLAEVSIWDLSLDCSSSKSKVDCVDNSSPLIVSCGLFENDVCSVLIVDSTLLPTSILMNCPKNERDRNFRKVELEIEEVQTELIRYMNSLSIISEQVRITDFELQEEKINRENLILQKRELRSSVSRKKKEIVDLSSKMNQRLRINRSEYILHLNEVYRKWKSKNEHEMFLKLEGDFESCSSNQQTEMNEQTRRYLFELIEKALLIDVTLVLEMFKEELIHTVLGTEDVVMRVVERNGLLLGLCSKEMRKNENVVFSALKNNVRSVKFVDQEFPENRIFYEQILRFSREQLKKVSHIPIFKHDEEISEIYFIRGHVNRILGMKQESVFDFIISYGYDPSRDEKNLRNAARVVIDQVFEDNHFVLMKRFFSRKCIENTLSEEELIKIEREIQDFLRFELGKISEVRMVKMKELKEETKKSISNYLLHLLEFINSVDLSEYLDKEIREYLFNYIRFRSRDKKVYYLGVCREKENSFEKVGYGIEFQITTSGFFQTVKKLWKIYEGSFKDNQRNGKGIEYESVRGNRSVEIFEGYFLNGKRHGRGQSYDPKTGSFQRGEWNHGNLDPASVLNMFRCPIIEYKDVQKQLRDATVIGRGGNGTVYLVKCSSVNLLKKMKTEIGEKVAVKIMKVKSSFERSVVFRMIRRGIGYCYSVNSPFILESYGIIRGANEVGYIMRLCEKSIDDEIDEGNIPLDEKIRILKSTAAGMKSLHSKFLIHRDLKWGNVLIDFDGNIKLCDFDTVKEDELFWRLKTMTQSSGVGTAGFRPPEVIQEKKYTMKGDVYAFGLMIYSLFWEEKSPYATQYQCTCGKKLMDILRSDGKTNSYSSFEEHVSLCNFRPLLTPEEVKKYPDYMIDLMIQCWDRNPFNRPSFDEILMRFDLAEKRHFSKITFKFVSHPEVPDQMMYFRRPFQRTKVIDWIEKKFVNYFDVDLNEENRERILEGRKVLEKVEEEGEDDGEDEKKQKTKVLSFEHPQYGTVYDDEDLKKIIQRETNPLLNVVLSFVDQSFILPQSGRKISLKESEKIEEENEMMKKQIKLLKRQILEQMKLCKKLEDHSGMQVTENREGKENEDIQAALILDLKREILKLNDKNRQKKVDYLKKKKEWESERKLLLEKIRELEN